MIWELSFKDFQDGCHGGHLGYPNGTILAILNLHVATMPPTEFQLYPTYGFGGDGRTTDNRPWHKLTWSKTAGEIIMYTYHVIKSMQ